VRVLGILARVPCVGPECCVSLCLCLSVSLSVSLSLSLSVPLSLSCPRAVRGQSVLESLVNVGTLTVSPP
jgi:hypothetical protein